MSTCLLALPLIGISLNQKVRQGISVMFREPALFSFANSKKKKKEKKENNPSVVDC